MKPEYNAGKNLKELMDAAAILYKDEMTMQAIADALSLNPIKVRKLLITAGVYESDTAKLVQQTFRSFRSTQNYSTAVTSTMSALQLSHSSVTSYLPYEKSVYFPEEAEAANATPVGYGQVFSLTFQYPPTGAAVTMNLSALMAARLQPRT